MKTLKKVILIDPPAVYPQTLNIGLGWLAANLVDVTESVKVIPFANISCSVADAELVLSRKVASEKPDIVGFNIHCNTYQTVIHMVRDLRTYFKGIIVVGGPHAMYEKRHIIEDNPEVDIVVMGEAEHSFARVCSSDYGQYDGIEGVIFRRGLEIVDNPLNSERKEFVGLKHPDYRQSGVTRIYSEYLISTSRGCPFSCCFCNPYMGGKFWRARPLDEVFQELEFAKKVFDIKKFSVCEPVFNLKPDRVIQFCEELIRRKIDLPWASSSGIRADFITRDMIRMMKKSGCTHIKIGVETLVPEILRHVDKGETVEDIKRAIDIVKAENMPAWGSFIIGLPYDTLRTARLNYQLSKKMRFDVTVWSLLFLYPGTKAYDWMKEHGRIYHGIDTAHQSTLDLSVQDLKKTPVVNVSCDTPEFPREERELAFWEINTKSGNYVFSVNDPDWVKAIVISRAIWKYDKWRIFWHVRRLIKLLIRKAKVMKRDGVRMDFTEGTF